MSTTQLSALSKTDLTQQINDHHRQANLNAFHAVYHACQAGLGLLEMKDYLPHGEFAQWAQKEFEGTARKAQRYMKIAKYRERLGIYPNPNATRVSYLAEGNPDEAYKTSEPDSIRKALRLISASEDDTPDGLQLSESNEWYTPEEYTEAARQVMGHIDLDPASCIQANETVKASRFFTEKDNGLAKQWKGKVWMNPPYGRDGNNKSNQGVWSKKLQDEFESGNVTQAIMLVNAVTDRDWFWPLWDHTICFCRKRIRFYSPEEKKAAPTHGNVLVYFGDNIEKFAKVAGEFGKIVVSRDDYNVVL
jgi:hypothetical protein